MMTSSNNFELVTEFNETSFVTVVAKCLFMLLYKMQTIVAYKREFEEPSVYCVTFIIFFWA